MSEVFRCEDKETLVAYLYGEIDADGRREVERHLRTCAACVRETEELQEVRHDLQLWMPPNHEVGFTIPPRTASAAPAPVLTSRRWASLHGLPAWAQVAAATLVIAAGAAIANVQVRSTGDGFTVTTGWMSTAPLASTPSTESAGSTALAQPVRVGDDQWRRELVALESRLQARIMAQQEAIKVSTAPRGVGDTGDAAAVLRRVQSMIEASEERQQQEMARRFIQAERTWYTRMTTDRATVNRQLVNLQGRTMAVQAGQQEMLNQFRLQRASAPQPNQ